MQISSRNNQEIKVIKFTEETTTTTTKKQKELLKASI